MKSILSSALLLISLQLIAQDDLYYTSAKQVDSIPKKANTIIIEGTQSRNEYFNAITNILFEAGYGIHSSDKEQGIITTSEKSFKKGVIKLTFLIKNKRVVLRGQYNLNMSIDFGEVTSEIAWSEIMYFGMKKSPNIIAWEEMIKVANQIQGNKVYAVK